MAERGGLAKRTSSRLSLEELLLLTGRLIGILAMAYHNGLYNLLYTALYSK